MFGLGSIFKRIFGSNDTSSSSYTYQYEPDKVEIAQIESDTKLRLADKELERIALSRDAQLELMKVQVWGQQAIAEARARGMAAVVQRLEELQTVINKTTQQRLALIEGAALETVRDVEKFYGEMESKIEQHNQTYMEERLPNLLRLLGSYEKGSAEYEMYKEQVDADRAREIQYVTEQVRYINQRLGKVIDSVLQSKEEVMKETAALTQSIAEQCLQLQGQSMGQQGQLAGTTPDMLTHRQATALPGRQEKMLPVAGDTKTTTVRDAE